MTTRRPALPPSLRRLRRGPRTLQIGRDPARALVLDGVGPAEAAFLGLLDGPRERAEALRDAAEVGVPPQEAARLLSLLEGSGLLDDGAGDVTAVRRLTPADRDRLGPDLACWALLRGGTAGAARALGRRRAARVAVAGTGRVARAVADLLGAAGVGQVAEQDPATGDTLAVLCSDDGALVPPQLSDRLLLAGVAHLVAETYETLGSVGPLVVPGRSACLRALPGPAPPRPPLAGGRGPAHRSGAGPGEQRRRARRHGWPHTRRWRPSPTSTTRPHPLRWRGRSPSSGWPDGGLRRRRFATHPACGCAWPGVRQSGQQPAG
ncbi:MAG TPA: hypothetical protein VIM19_20615 [Actinomycetes bacterium]